MYFVISAMKGEAHNCMFLFRVILLKVRSFLSEIQMTVKPRRSSTLLFVLYHFPKCVTGFVCAHPSCQLCCACVVVSGKC